MADIRKKCPLCGRKVYVVQTDAGPRWSVHKGKPNATTCANSARPVN